MDNRTLFTVLVSVLLVQAAALAQTWRQNREEIGLRDWAVAGVCMACGSLFGALGLYIGDADASPSAHLTSAVIATAGSSVGATGWFFVWLGARHFYGKPTAPYSAVAVFTAVLTVVLALGLFLPLPVEWRTTWISTATAVFSTLTLYEFQQPRLMRNPMVLLVRTVLLFTSVTWLLRGLASLDHEAYVNEYAFTYPLALYDGIIASVTFTVAMIVLTNERIHGRLRDQATIDPLTGIMNRRAFFETAAPTLSALQRKSDRIAVCLLDIDHFKQINDRCGHAAGDAVLKQFAHVARHTLREGDLLARYGGEEFAILLHDSDHTQAEQILGRLRQACADRVFIPHKEACRLTFSAGICHASGPVHVGLEVLLEAADRALYRAKNDGRNRTVTASEHYGTEAIRSWEGVA